MDALTFNCEFCAEPLDPNAPGTHKRVLAWFPNKGTSTPILPSPPTGWAHYGCIEIQKKYPVNAGSSKLF